MSLLRRRMMMSKKAASFFNYLAGYQLPQTTNSYDMKSEWLDERTVRLIGGGNSGSSYGARIFAGKPQNAAGRNDFGWAAGSATEEIQGFEAGKNYRLTMTITKVNTALAANNRLDIAISYPSFNSHNVQASFSAGAGVGDSITLNFSGYGWRALTQGHSGRANYDIEFDLVIE